MKRFLVVLAIFAIAMAGTLGVLWWYDSWNSGGADTATAERDLPPFSRVAIGGFTDVTLVQGSAEGISIQGAPDYLRRLRLDVTDGTLTIASPRVRHWWLDFFGGDSKPVRIKLTYRTLDTIGVEGAATVRADRLQADRVTVTASGASSLRIAALEANELTVTGSGALKMEVAGRVATQRIRTSGAGDYRAPKLDSQAATVTVSGAGRVVVRAEKTLDIVVSGAGVVEYIGNPKVTQDIRGVGSIRRRSAD